MIPPSIATAFAKPLVKWGAIGGAVLLLVAFTTWQTYDMMRTACEDEKMVAVQAAASAAAESARQQLMATIELNARIAQERDENGRELQALQESVRKKARKYAGVKIAVPADLVRIHDEYARVSETSGASDALPADLGTGRAEIQSGTVPTETEHRVQVKLGNDTVTMTVEGTVLMLSDTYDKFGACLNDYSGFNGWNNGRERLELERLQHD